MIDGRMMFKKVCNSDLFYSVIYKCSVLIILLQPVSLFAYIDYPYATSFQTIRVPLGPQDIEKPEKNHVTMRMNIRWMNVWSIQSDRFIIDGEEAQVEPSVRYSLTDKIMMGAYWPLKVQSGGILDSSIEAFHSTVNVTQGGREYYPRNKLNVSYEPFGAFYALMDNNPLKTFLRRYNLRDYPRERLDPPVNNISSIPGINLEYIPVSGADRYGAGNPVSYIQTNVMKGSDWFDTWDIGMTYRWSIVKQPELFASPGNDFSVYSVIEKHWFDYNMSGKLGASVTHFQKRNYQVFKLPAYQFVLRPSLTYYGYDWNLLVEYFYFSRPVDNFSRLSAGGHQIALAVQKRLDDDRLLTLGFSENLIEYSVTPDIGFFFSLDFADFRL